MKVESSKSLFVSYSFVVVKLMLLLLDTIVKTISLKIKVKIYV